MRTGQLLPRVEVNQELSDMGVMEIVRLEEKEFMINICWLVWCQRPGSDEQKNTQLDEVLKPMLPEGSTWDTI